MTPPTTRAAAIAWRVFPFLFLLALACFVLPFVSVSITPANAGSTQAATGKAAIMTVTGIELATGKDITVSVADQETQQGHMDGDFTAIVAALAVLLGLLYSLDVLLRLVGPIGPRGRERAIAGAAVTGVTLIFFVIILFLTHFSLQWTLFCFLGAIVVLQSVFASVTLERIASSLSLASAASIFFLVLVRLSQDRRITTPAEFLSSATGKAPTVASVAVDYQFGYWLALGLGVAATLLILYLAYLYIRSGTPTRLLWSIATPYIVFAVLIYVVVRLNEVRFDWAHIADYFFNPLLLQGAGMTIFLSVVSQFLGIVLGLVAALFRISKNPTLNVISGFYIWLFRGTPLLVQLIVFATGLYTIGIKLDLLVAAILAFSLNEGAYMAEIVRAGIESVDPGQMEAAKSLGMTYGLGMRRIVLPQAARVIIPPTGNEFNNMLKSSSLAFVIGTPELLARAGDINHLTFRNLETFVIISVYYLAMTTVVTWGQSWIEGRLGERKSQQQVSFWTRVRANVLRVRRVGGS